MELRRYQYLYAVIDPSMEDMCVDIQDTTINHSGNPNYIPITKVADYLFKYYNRADGKWYYDAEHTQEWIPV